MSERADVPVFAPHGPLLAGVLSCAVPALLRRTQGSASLSSSTCLPQPCIYHKGSFKHQNKTLFQQKFDFLCFSSHLERYETMFRICKAFKTQSPQVLVGEVALNKSPPLPRKRASDKHQQLLELVGNVSCPGNCMECVSFLQVKAWKHDMQGVNILLL